AVALSPHALIQSSETLSHGPTMVSEPMVRQRVFPTNVVRWRVSLNNGNYGVKITCMIALKLNVDDPS
ncbi:hypothetical protein A2U01_0063821, partial [Trifolium medium]|nr:hypothetical protein [Trifolium medium]